MTNFYKSGDGELPPGLDLERLFESAFPEDYNHSMRRTRPYSGQPHTDQGERGKALVSGLTMRDVCDCFVRGLFLSTGPGPHYSEASKGEAAALALNDMHSIDLSKIDPQAWMQNMMCEVERMMGIFPNVPKLVSREDVYASGGAPPGNDTVTKSSSGDKSNG